MRIKFGYEVGTGEPVYVPLHHTIITGITQLAGKTTALEGMIIRSGLPALVFRVKRGESSFTDARTIPPVFRERTDWRFIEALIEAIMREPQRWNRAQIIKATRGARTLRDIWDNVKKELARARKGSVLESIYTNLDAYFEIVIPKIESLNLAPSLDLKPGVNVVDMEGWEPELQSLIIASCIEEVASRHQGVVTVIPEAWEFVPAARKTPVKLAAERLARTGAAVRNFLFLDSQNLMGVDANIRSQLGVWILGVQRYEHEVERTVKAIPLPPSRKPRPHEVMNLRLGEFYVVTMKQVVKAYAQPAWLPDHAAIKVAKGELTPEEARDKFYPKLPPELQEIKRIIAKLEARI